ncbi:MAG: diguanylate cyclase [Burkholderiales bacterium PBB3]|nr:MAG: diguanylate cyclase [Burkholderiales bacterium PBB3]
MGKPTFEIDNRVATRALLEMCKRLERAWALDDILHGMTPAIEDVLGYRHSWLALFGHPPGFINVISHVDSGQAQKRDVKSMNIPVAGDAMLEELLTADHVVVVEDARTDPRTNKEVVAHLQNRTIINVPLVLADERFGAIGIGTFGDIEGVRPPQPWHLEFLQTVAGHVAVALDRVRFMAARKKAEEALQQTLDLTNNVIQSMQDGFLMLDTQGILVEVNPAFCALVGFTREELLGQGAPYPYWPPEEIGSLQEAFSAAGEESFAQMELILMRKNGERFPTFISPSAVRNPQGQTVNFIATVKDVSERKKAEDEIRFQALHDELTGLGNRRAFDQILSRAFAQTRQSDQHHVMCYLDIDEFKVVNDTCGHSAGDELLRQVARLFTEALRGDDHLCRIGGDEFGIILQNQTVEQAVPVAQRLQAGLANYRFAWQSQTFGVGVSIGMVALDADSESVEALMQAADSSCYVAKDAGRGRIHVYAKDDQALTQRHGVMEWVSRIEHALMHDRLVLFAQPIVPLAPEATRGLHCEILLRMLDDQDQLVAPGLFMPAAERYHLATRIDRWVVSHAFDWLLAHQADIELCSINLSGQSLGDTPFMAFVLQSLGSSGVPADKLCFEITETAAIRNMHTATHFIDTLRQRGCKLSLDDFGSGLSSFAYLRTLPVDVLKIDGQFVKDMAQDPVSLAMVKSIHDIGCLMGKQTVAEFVENDAILELLHGIGVHYAQGYAVGYPQPLDAVLAQYRAGLLKRT